MNYNFRIIWLALIIKPPKCNDKWILCRKIILKLEIIKSQIILMIVFSCHGDFSDVTCKRGVANELLVPIYIPTDDNIGHCCPYTQVL